MDGPPTTCIERTYRACATASSDGERASQLALRASMLAVPCGLPTYVGAWPPVVAGAP